MHSQQYALAAVCTRNINALAAAALL
jgi:hypothetical protein